MPRLLAIQFYYSFTIHMAVKTKTPSRLRNQWAARVSLLIVPTFCCLRHNWSSRLLSCRVEFTFCMYEVVCKLKSVSYSLTSFGSVKCAIFYEHCPTYSVQCIVNSLLIHSPTRAWQKNLKLYKQWAGIFSPLFLPTDQSGILSIISFLNVYISL